MWAVLPSQAVYAATTSPTSIAAAQQPGWRIGPAQQPCTTALCASQQQKRGHRLPWMAAATAHLQPTVAAAGKAQANSSHQTGPGRSAGSATTRGTVVKEHNNYAASSSSNRDACMEAIQNAASVQELAGIAAGWGYLRAQRAGLVSISGGGNVRPWSDIKIKAIHFVALVVRLPKVVTPQAPGGLKAARREATRLVTALIPGLMKQVGIFSQSRGLSNMVWALAKLELSASDMRNTNFSALLEYLLDKVVTPEMLAASGGTQETSSLVWGLARLTVQGHLSKQQQLGVVPEEEPSPSEGLESPVPASKQGSKVDGWWRVLLDHAHSNLHNLKPTDLSMLVWSMAHVGRRGELSLLSAVAARAESVLPQLKQQELSNVLWAMATLLAGADALQAAYTPQGSIPGAASQASSFTVGEEAAVLSGGSGKGQRDANLLQLRAPINRLFRAAAEYISRDTIGPHWKAQHVANVMWAFTTHTEELAALGQTSREQRAIQLASRLARNADRHYVLHHKQYQAGELSMLAWSIARLATYCTPEFWSVAAAWLGEVRWSQPPQNLNCLSHAAAVSAVSWYRETQGPAAGPHHNSSTTTGPAAAAQGQGDHGNDRQLLDEKESDGEEDGAAGEVRVRMASLGLLLAAEDDELTASRPPSDRTNPEGNVVIEQPAPLYPPGMVQVVRQSFEVLVARLPGETPGLAATNTTSSSNSSSNTNTNTNNSSSSHHSTHKKHGKGAKTSPPPPSFKGQEVVAIMLAASRLRCIDAGDVATILPALIARCSPEAEVTRLARRVAAAMGSAQPGAAAPLVQPSQESGGAAGAVLSGSSIGGGDNTGNPPAICGVAQGAASGDAPGNSGQVHQPHHHHQQQQQQQSEQQANDAGSGLSPTQLFSLVEQCCIVACLAVNKLPSNELSQLVNAHIKAAARHTLNAIRQQHARAKSARRRAYSRSQQDEWGSSQGAGAGSGRDEDVAIHQASAGSISTSMPANGQQAEGVSGQPKLGQRTLSFAHIADATWAFGRQAHPDPTLFHTLGLAAAAQLKPVADKYRRLQQSLPPNSSDAQPVTGNADTSSGSHSSSGGSSLPEMSQPQGSDFVTSSVWRTGFMYGRESGPLPRAYDGSLVTPNDLACLALGMSWANYYNETLYDIWADACLLVLGLASPGNLYSIASAMARASYFHLPLLNGVATVSLAKLSTFPQTQLSTLMWAYAHLHAYHPGLFKEGVRLYATRVQQGVPVHPDYTSMVLWSCAVIQHMDWASLGTLFARMWAIAPETLQGATRNQLYFSYLMCLLSYRQHLLRSASVTSSGGESDITPAMKELMEHPMLGPDLMSSTSGSKPGGNTNGTSGGTSSGGAAAVPADPAVLIALESLIAAMASETSQPCPIPFMPQHYRQQYSSTFASFKHDVNISFLQSDVFRLLKAMGCSPRMEVPVKGGLFTVDIVVPWRGREVAIEVDGPSHFALNISGHPLGHTASRDRCLTGLGVPLASIPFLEWRAAAAAATQLLRQQQEGQETSDSLIDQQWPEVDVMLTAEGIAGAKPSGRRRRFKPRSVVSRSHGAVSNDVDSTAKDAIVTASASHSSTQEVAPDDVAHMVPSWQPVLPSPSPSKDGNSPSSSDSTPSTNANNSASSAQEGAGASAIKNSYVKALLPPEVDPRCLYLCNKLDQAVSYAASQRDSSGGGIDVAAAQSWVPRSRLRQVQRSKRNRSRGRSKGETGSQGSEGQEQGQMGSSGGFTEVEGEAQQPAGTMADNNQHDHAQQASVGGREVDSGRSGEGSTHGSGSGLFPAQHMNTRWHAVRRVQRVTGPKHRQGQGAASDSDAE